MRVFLNLLYQYLIGIAVILAVLEIMWGGFLWMGSGASVTSKESGKKKINMALVGLLLVLSPYLVFQIINPSALSLQLGENMPLNQPPPTTTPAPAPLPGGCTPISGTNEYVETFDCPISSKASDVCPSNLISKISKICDSFSVGRAPTCNRDILYCSSDTELPTYVPVFLSSGILSFGDKIFFPNIGITSTYNDFNSTCQKEHGGVKKMLSINLKTKKGAVQSAYKEYINSLATPKNDKTKFIFPSNESGCSGSAYPSPLPKSPYLHRIGALCFETKLSCVAKVGVYSQ